MLDDITVSDILGHGTWSAAIEPRPRSQVVRVMGELDIAEATIFEATMRRHIVDGRNFVLDLRECSYLDSTIIRVLIRLSLKLGEALRVVSTPGSAVDRLFHITNLYEHLNIILSLDGE